MKLFYTFLSLFFLSTSLFSQVKVSVNDNNTTIREVLKDIEQNSGIRFFYSDDMTEINDIISINAKNQNITDVLDQMFSNTSLTYKSYENNLFVIVPKEYSQQKITISGRVTDINGAPVPGVNVIMLGTMIGVATDEKGNYTLTVPDKNSVIEFSFIGYVTQVLPIGNKTTLNVVLTEDSQLLEEIVVVGYGTVKKESLSGSISNITSDDIVTTKTENLISNVQGKVSGLQIRQLTGEPGVFSNYVSIRGFGAPLVIIDGIMRDGTEDMAQLNPDDIESMSILKDASAAIYGMNAANGVIIITTKKGKSGKTRFSYSTRTGWKTPTGLEHTVDAYTYRLVKNEMDRNTGVAESYTADVLEKYKQGIDGYIDTDWIDLTLKDWAFSQSHTFSVNGGNEKVQFFHSLAYSDDSGLLKSNIQKYDRFNFRSTTTAALTKNLKMNVSVSGRYDNTQQPREAFLWTLKTIMVNDRGLNWHTIANEDHYSAIAPENKNAVALMDPNVDGYNRRKNMQAQSTVDLIYTIPGVKGLKILATGAFDFSTRNTSFLQKSYDIYDYYTDAFVTTTGTNQYSNSLSTNQRAVARLQAQYSNTFGKHDLSLTGAGEYTQTRNDYLFGSRLYTELFTNDILDQASSTTAANSGYRRYGKYAALIFRGNYSYAGKYLLEVLARYDGSYRYAPGHRWTLFPSVSAGWRISEESFIKNNLRFISNLKLRASYGQSGTDAGNAFQYISAYSAGNGYVFNDGTLTTGMTAAGVVTDNLSWVTATLADVGIDFGFFKGKLSGEFDLFQRKNTGVLANSSSTVPNTFGASLPQENLNSNLTHGFDLSLAYRGKIGSDFNFRIQGNFTYSRYKYLHNENNGYSSSWDYWRNSRTNRYSGYMWLYEWDGRYTNIEEYETAPLMGGSAGNSKMVPGSYKIKDVNGDGIINSSDQSNDNWTYGTINPPMQYGLTLEGSYKNFDFNILFQGASGYSINYRNNDIWGYGRYPTLHEKYLDRWHTANTTDDPFNPSTQWIEGFYPALRNYNYNNTTEANVIDVWRPNATYVRLKNIEFGYSLPTTFTQRIKIEKVRIYVNATNLFTICNKLLKDADPERQEADWDAGLNYPLMKAINVGININF